MCTIILLKADKISLDKCVDSIMLQSDHLLSLNWEILQLQQILQSAWKLKTSNPNHAVIL